jgi:Matrixin
MAPARRLPTRLLLALTLALLGTLLLATAADAFRLGGHRWPTRTIRYYNAAKASAQPVADAAKAWNASGARVRFVATSRRRARVVIAPLTTAARQRLGLTELGLATLGWADPRSRARNPVGSGTVRGNRVWLVPPGAAGGLSRTSLAQVAAHELGHVLGLDHTTGGCATMNPRLNERCQAPAPWQAHCRILEADDVRGVIRRYGGKLRALGPQYCDVAAVPGPPLGLTGTLTDPRTGAIALQWTNPTGVSFQSQFTLDAIAGRATVNGYYVNAALDACPSLSTTAALFAADAAVADAPQSVSTFVPTPGHWCFTVGIQDVFQRFGPPASVYVDVPAPTPVPAPR